MDFVNEHTVLMTGPGALQVAPGGPELRTMEKSEGKGR